MSDVQACTKATQPQSGRNFDRNADATSLHPVVAVKVAGAFPREPQQTQTSLSVPLRKLALETPPSQRHKKRMVGSPTGVTVREVKEEEKQSKKEEKKQQGAGRLNEENEEEKIEKKEEEKRGRGNVKYREQLRVIGKDRVLHRIVLVVREKQVAQ